MKISNRSMIMQELRYRLSRLEALNKELDNIQTVPERIEISRQFEFHTDQIMRTLV
jgi:hypothetical protein